jgi:hypothetical protein
MKPKRPGVPKASPAMRSCLLGVSIATLNESGVHSTASVPLPESRRSDFIGVVLCALRRQMYWLAMCWTPPLAESLVLVRAPGWALAWLTKYQNVRNRGIVSLKKAKP